MNDSNLTSARLTLRKPTLNDLGTMFEIFSDPETNRFNPAGPIKTIDAARSRLELWIEHWHRHGFGQWAVSLRDEPETTIGFGGLAYKRFGSQEKVNLGFRFATTAWGKGLATELSEFSVDYGFKVLHFEEIWGTVRENHMASRRILEKVSLMAVDRVPGENGAAASIIYVAKIPAGS